MNNLNITWRDVFDPYHKLYGWLPDARDAAIDVGYEYMCWNGHILKIHKDEYTGDGSTVEDTGITTDDL